MGFLVIFIQKAIGQGIGILYGALGEIMTEKSGNLNLGIPGMMYMGGIAGLIGAFLYENGTANPNGLVGLLISFVCAFVCAALGGLDSREGGLSGSQDHQRKIQAFQQIGRTADREKGSG